METPATPRYRVPDDVAWVDGTEIGLGEELSLTRLPSGETIQLAGTGRMIWLKAIDAADPVAAVSELVGGDHSQLEEAVNGFLDGLRAEGWLGAR